MERVAAFACIARVGEVRLYERKQPDCMVAGGRSRQLGVDLRKHVSGRREPRVLGVLAGPIVERVFREQCEMHRVLGKYLVRFVAVTYRNDLVPYA